MGSAKTTGSVTWILMSFELGTGAVVLSIESGANPMGGNLKASMVSRGSLRGVFGGDGTRDAAETSERLSKVGLFIPKLDCGVKGASGAFDSTSNTSLAPSSMSSLTRKSPGLI